MPDRRSDEALQGLLRALLQRTMEEVRAAKERGLIELQREKYILRPDFSLRYSVDPAIIDFPLEEGEEEVWHYKDLQAFLDAHIKPLVEYQDALRAVEAAGERKMLLDGFVSRIAYDSALSTGGQAVERHVETLLGDLSGGPQEYRTKVWLTGITLTQDTLRVSDLLTFRRPTRADMQQRVNEQMLHYAHAFHGQVWFSCIAEFRVCSQNVGYVQREIDRLVTALRLFRLGSVATGRYELDAESFSGLGRARIGGLSSVARIRYELSRSDVPNLDRFLNTLMSLLPSSYDFPARKPDFLSTALQWYSEALLRTTPTEGAVAWAIACLEALFLGDNPSTELLYRLTQRTASLLRCFAWAPLDLQKIMKTAYAVRSKYVHGAVPKGLSQEQLTKLFEGIAEYARVSCLIWIQFVGLNGLDRRKILNILEEALVDDNARTELNRWCNRVGFARQAR
jgi:hypothetical protein